MPPLGLTEATAGKLTYALFKICRSYLGQNYRFQQIAEVLGSLEVTKLELQRRYIGIYEQQKLEENGDV